MEKSANVGGEATRERQNMEKSADVGGEARTWDLTRKDFDGYNIPETPFECLRLVVSVATSKYYHQKAAEREERERERRERERQRRVLLPKQRQEERRREEQRQRRRQQLARARSNNNDISNLNVLLKELRRYIEQNNGTRLALLIKKDLSNTDLSRGQGRLSLPSNNIEDEDFLTPEEKHTLTLRSPEDNRLEAVSVTLLLPSPAGLRQHPEELKLKKWDMKKKSGKVSSSYVIVSGWNKVVLQNGLSGGLPIQIWSFRVGARLFLALLR